ncbi:MAG: cyclic peptide export ABC transporter [Cytophagales bacterium]|nr:cyclic peptide export ABC transporter [Cytophagales bacterium]
MEFLAVFFKRSKLFYLALAVLSIINGLLNTGLLMFINHTVAGERLPYYPRYDWLLFVLLLGFSLLATKLFQTYMLKLTFDIRHDFQVSILRKLKYATYQDFEKLGNERVFTAMGDITTLSNLPEVFMNVVRAIIVVVCSFTYLFFISPVGGGAILLLMAALLVFYMVRNQRIEKQLNAIRTLQNDYWRYLNDLLLGFKETKMSIARNERIHSDFLEKNMTESKALRMESSTRYLNNELTGSYSWYLTLGVILFALPRLFDLSYVDTSAFIITILYLMGPVAILITLVPTYTNVKIALERLDDFNAKVNAQVKDERQARQPANGFGPFEHLRLDGVKFEYFDEKEQKSFVWGPVDLEVRKGETVFVVGGNGSGKSTLVYLLTGLYRPVAGAIYLNGIRVDEDNYPHYRDRIGAIFTSNYLFNENYDGFDLSPRNPALQELIETMQLEGIVRFREDKNMLDRNLSKGQQKRLAMIFALLEDKPLLVLDEWAAEQDPAFRNYFYKTLLPSLKQAGKTIVAITHDDEYYGYADTVIKFNYGRVVTDALEPHALPGREAAVPGGSLYVNG